MSARVAAGGSSSKKRVLSEAQAVALPAPAQTSSTAPVPEKQLAPGQVEKRNRRIVFYLTDSEYLALNRKANARAGTYAREILTKTLSAPEEAAVLKKDHHAA